MIDNVSSFSRFSLGFPPFFAIAGFVSQSCLISHELVVFAIVESLSLGPVTGGSLRVFGMLTRYLAQKRLSGENG